ncbi:glycosyltransferase [Sphingomonas sp.]|uniref:glycosyltransferase n=1 Tax=Sphingomonas sp. TaxID=28214 RepID=UPI003B3BD517
MKIILAATPATGHLDPLLGIGRLLVEQGHEVLLYSGSAFRERAETIGARFEPLPAGADFDLRDPDACFPARAGLTGPEIIEFDFRHIFTDPLPQQYAGLKKLLAAFPADIVITEQLFLGALPLIFEGGADRPVVIGCGITFLSLDRSDGLPHGLGLDYAADADVRAHLQQTLLPEVMAALAPIQSMYEDAARATGVEPKGSPIGAMARYADIFWQGGVPEIEFPLGDVPEHLAFVGRWPAAPSAAPPPAWADDLDGRRTVVLVTQGTVANADLDQLVLPTIRALAGRDDLLVLGTTGRRPLPLAPSALPANARLETYLPFDWLMPKVDILVTNGGYGTVLMGLAEGAPVIIAGASEDKPDIAARIGWAKAGINLRTGTPSEASLAEAVDRVLVDAEIKASVARIARSIETHDATAIILDAIDRIAAARQGKERTRAA